MKRIKKELYKYITKKIGIRNTLGKYALYCCRECKTRQVSLLSVRHCGKKKARNRLDTII